MANKNIKDICILIQARLGSQRVQKKMLRPFAGSNLVDILSNGVKMRASDSNYNQATTFHYLAFAENPFKYETAR